MPQTNQNLFRPGIVRGLGMGCQGVHTEQYLGKIFGHPAVDGMAAGSQVIEHVFRWIAKVKRYQGMPRKYGVQIGICRPGTGLVQREEPQRCGGGPLGQVCWRFDRVPKDGWPVLRSQHGLWCQCRKVGADRWCSGRKNNCSPEAFFGVPNSSA